MKTASRVTISVTNPWTGAMVERDVTDLTQAELDAYAQVMCDCDREQANSQARLGWTPGQWLAAYVEHVGPDAAGTVILGS